MKEKTSLNEKIRWAEAFLREKGIATPRLEAEVLIAHVLGKTKGELYRDLPSLLSNQELLQIEKIVFQRAEYVPTAYLLGKWEFMSLDFKVSQDVLIPRPETEILVEAIIKEYSNANEPVLIDVGTGSGAIAVSLAKNLPQAKILAVDISPKALEIARENADSHQVSHQITFFSGNLLGPIPGELRGRVDCIAANLPYVPIGAKEQLQPEVQFYEPSLALFAGVDGFDLYRQLIPPAHSFLKKQGKLALEIGLEQGELVYKELLPEKWNKIEIIKDYQGLDRIVWAQRN